ncbi:F-box only protein 48 [Pelodytes ibericus]
MRYLNMDQRDEIQDDNKSYFDCLPTEIVYLVLAQLDLRSLCIVSTTCRLLNQMVDNHDVLWKKHCLDLIAIRPSDIQKDQNNGYTWKELLQGNYNRNKTKQEWLDGHYSNISSFSDLPENSMYPMNADDWGDIFKAELER